MPTVTYDGRSFMLDGRRIWLVSGSLHYARIPREQWAARIHAAKLAGLNTIGTPVFWSRHEPRPGQFDFSGDNDLRHFVQLVGQAGMLCILRPGPYVGEDADLGGLPPWLLAMPQVQLRTANNAFLEACSRYLLALADQIRDLQVTSPGKGGPIILVQNESHWTCGQDDLAARYLGELSRYLREAGITVPTINSNSLWQGTEGEIDCWTGSRRMLSTVRQLATVRPDQPKLVIEFNIGPAPTWGNPAPKPLPPGTLQRRLAQVLAAGGQFNIHPFHGGTNLGFFGGRAPEFRDGYVTTSYDPGCPISETGAPGPSYEAIRRICTFASRFSRVFANLDPEYRPVVADPSPAEAGGSADECDCAVAYARGTQGGVAFLFGADPLRGAGGSKDRVVGLLLPNGSRLPVPLGNQAVAWCLFDAYLGGRARLDYSSLNALAVVGRVFVCFGPAGAEGLVSINGSPLHVTVPKGRAPLVMEHEGAVVVVASDEGASTIYPFDDAVYIGVAGLSAAGDPIGLPGEKSCTRISATGESASVPVTTPGGGGRKGGSAAAPKAAVADWAAASLAEYFDGTSARYAAISGPADLAALGSPYGYGWYRLRFRSSDSRRARIAFPQSADRLHVAIDGQDVGVVGLGPGAADDLTVAFKKGQHTMVVLAENLGRAAGGVNLAESKGLYGPLWEVKPLKVAKGTLKRGDPLDVLKFRSPVWEVQEGELTLPDRVTWAFAHRKKTPIIVRFDAFAGRGLLLLNEKPIHFMDRGGWDRLLIEPDAMKTGNNTLQLALLPDPGADPAASAAALAGAVEFLECVGQVSAKGEWAFAKWEPPAPSGYEPLAKPAARKGPTWWRARLEAAATDAPLMLDLSGMTKGQIYVNGRHLGRYFVATADGKAVPPQAVYHVPAPFVRPGPDNELVLFDEHGGSPARVRAFYPA